MIMESEGEVMETCKFNRAWRGVCGKAGCTEHQELLCCVCKSPATHECEATLTLGVCGKLLCNDCEHYLSEEGTTRASQHVRKSEQIHKPWYEQDLEDNGPWPEYTGNSR